VRGDFPAGLAEELLKKWAGTAEWCGGFLKGAVNPFADPQTYLFGNRSMNPYPAEASWSITLPRIRRCVMSDRARGFAARRSRPTGEER
jgi:hypothetical protein